MTKKKENVSVFLITKFFTFLQTPSPEVKCTVRNGYLSLFDMKRWVLRQTHTHTHHTNTKQP